MKGHENRRITQTKKFIQESLILLMEQKPLYKISIKELCDKAGINRSTFYNHYKSQYEVFDEIEKNYLDSINALFANSPKGKNPGDSIVELMRYIDQNLAVSKILLPNKADEEFSIKMKKISKVVDAIKSMQNYVSPSVFKETSEFCLAGCYAVLVNWINEKEDRKSPEEIAIIISQLSRNLCDYNPHTIP